MPLLDLRQLPPEGPLLGLDPGTKTIGVAAADATRVIASPLETVKRGKLAADAARLFALYDERACVGLVIGLPLNMDGSEGPRAQSVRAFARNLMAVRDAPAAFWDERLSTAAVERTLLAADASRARRKEVVDAMAAAYILQGALDRLGAEA
ncbi:MAG: Holliday junction resolvase RuvX [Caulobacterales bacterium]|nr:Holliday junction resolvase RuvX [Caulobacterales bacterium]